MKYSSIWQLAVTLILPIAVSAEPVPDFVGSHLSEIKANPKFAAIDFEIQKVDSPKRLGEVLLQIPGAGSELGTNRRMFFKISDGLVVPSVVGLTQTEAEAKLRAAGIGSEATHRPYTGIKESRVADQIPTAGTRIDTYRKIVFLVVSNDAGVKVPSPKTESVEKILKQLSSVGLVGRIIRSRVDSGTYPGAYYCLNGTALLFKKVATPSIALSPIPGTLVDIGSEVIVNSTYYHYEPPYCGKNDRGYYFPR